RRLQRANRARAGRTEEVLVDAVERGRAIARSVRDAPEIDGRVLVEGGGSLRAGTFASVKIDGAKGYDLIAVPAG
ncbi:MAG TPA: 30S ribosomal protein S12 methylthiotransferase RimO, partial [Planctomycetota bacterium]|nr:30S ribosomal protein S12 methylthiotransferase RimO [Planctomycetota bacterium]